VIAEVRGFNSRTPTTEINRSFVIMLMYSVTWKGREFMWMEGEEDWGRRAEWNRQNTNSASRPFQTNCTVSPVWVCVMGLYCRTFSCLVSISFTNWGISSM